jgi:hypothetical protein
MNRNAIWVLLLLIVPACKNKEKKDEKKNYFTVLPFLQAQLARLDTSKYSFTVIETGAHGSDTFTIPASRVREYAKDFLSLPDIASESMKDDFTESVIFDEPSKSILLNYTPNDPEQEIRRETIVLNADEKGEGEVQTIIIDWFQENKDATIIKNMLWEVDKKFQVITKTSDGVKPEEIRTLSVRWR